MLNYVIDWNGCKKIVEVNIIYLKFNDSIIIDFAKMLKRYKKEIINSFICLEDNGETVRRLSNGIMESFNNVPKDFKRISNGLSDYEYVRSRILWSKRDDVAILANPKPLSVVKGTGKSRGQYNKKTK